MVNGGNHTPVGIEEVGEGGTGKRHKLILERDISAQWRKNILSHQNKCVCSQMCVITQKSKPSRCQRTTERKRISTDWMLLVGGKERQMGFYSSDIQYSHLVNLTYLLHFMLYLDRSVERRNLGK